MKKEKLLIYPYDGEFSPILRHKNLIENYNVVRLESPRGWGLTGRDGGEADGGGYLGITVTSDFEKSLDLCDAILFSESRNQVDFDKFIMPKVISSIKRGKNIIFTIPLDCNTYNIILGECEKGRVDFKYYGIPIDQEKSYKIDVNSEFLYNIDTPVIFVLGIGERTNKFEIQLALRENIIKMGYNVIQIGTRGYCELLGFHSFPEFMYGGMLSETNKIALFNHFIKKLETNEKPDVIIIGVPGGIIPFNNKLTNRFGVLAYEVSQAVTPDSTVFSWYYEKYSTEYFNKMIDSIKYRLGCKVDCYNLTNVMFDWNNSRLENKMLYISLDSKIVDTEKIRHKELNISVFNVLNQKDAFDMADCLIGKLREYGVAEYV